VISYFFFAG